ncbi:MAG: bifunctional adenosylcobinamide kinase/adenosylcobinamide-phosphate guanylyltransferase [Gammaproteobacteria bacterium]|uniref:bifunctional adenosylcobinamide kinase/adenosylcobinamide-phosphate guanylyltransferase n=1 Tax=Rhodoferax sp. TaxID=50421 RepID=UPI0017FEBB50|nr:bifunctional adenosylcobinamide kinase/adenosylcobinamide-phosphate guanylyltransferase [Rhodoferax sp.]MBU3897605.1 bifunctional adenosylcobinamide kinase/adenosylcobinamide-phosphate guanylyltransferase [Gammaproteobacteria bacterium]MBA3058231.1 bifunctional adenosylcobinamide kinase/adenosylcobinamide-phosphate guanylyltransferase [Rhodoferax sp.]MBU3999490.1 bifunctional adenosylcobinamide kinase/adenosylcobinamide-phosphate guanylyltransferase [Gammaproteobacteria bacterium]MBU4017751.
MGKALPVARSELILGGQKSGKSRRGELLARDWLAQSGSHRAVLIATAQPWDDEMRQRIGRHQLDRAERVPGMRTVEEPLRLAEAIQSHSRADTLIVVDCLTLWLTNCLMPFDAELPSDTPGTVPTPADVSQEFIRNKPLALIDKTRVALLLVAIKQAPGPLVLVGNEIGLGVIPLGREVRAFVDALGLLNQSVAGACQRVTLMAAGLPLTLKDVT